MDALETPQVVETPPGTPPAPTSGESTVSTPSDGGGDGSLSDHEAAHGPAAKADEREDRNERGQFAPRRRAVSQRADADDVPVINELTKRLKAAEEAAGKDIARNEGESDRVYILRRRAEIAERLAAPKAAPTPAPVPQAPVPQVRHQAPQPAVAQTFPAYEAFVQIPGYEGVDYDTYRDLRDDWGYQRRREQEKAAETAEAAQRAFMDSLSEHSKREVEGKAAYPDWDAVVMPGHTVEQGGMPISYVVRDAILASKKGHHIQYFLGKHRDVLHELNADSQDYSPSAVAAMRRYLDTLVAPATSSPPPRAAAGPTGAALTLVSPPAPKPPTPVRTGAVTSADDPPGDDSQSLAAHEKHFGRARR